VDAVTTFILSEAPLASIRVNPNHDIISVSVQVKEAEALFAVKLAVFLHNATGTRLIRATSGYSLPADIAELVAVVGDLFSLPRINTPLRASGAVGAWPNACSGLSGCSVPPPPPTHTLTRPPARPLARPFARLPARPPAPSTCARTCVRTQTYTRAQVRALACNHTRMHARSDAHVPTCTFPRTLAHTTH
jgi:hypothetical protein